MTDRIKRMLIGFGLMFGLQVIISSVASTWFGIAGDVYNIVGIPLILTLAVYFGGGLVMGLLAEKAIWVELFLASVVSLTLNVILFIVGAAPDLTFISIASVSNSPILSLIVNFGSIILASFAGGYLGARTQTPTNDWISRSMPLIGFLSLVVGPFLLLMASGQNQGRSGLPWYVMVIVGLSFLVVSGIGYILFNSDRNNSHEFSISPNRRK
jgi:hypothetical protein